LIATSAIALTNKNLLIFYFLYAAEVQRDRHPQVRAALNSTPIPAAKLTWSCLFGYAKRSHPLRVSVAMACHRLSANIAGIDEDDFHSRLPAATLRTYDFGLGSSASHNE
jgi:hypothetical protein